MSDERISRKLLDVVPANKSFAKFRQDYRDKVQRIGRCIDEDVISGVLVDFRHPALPPGEWEAFQGWNEDQGSAVFPFNRLILQFPGWHGWEPESAFESEIICLSQGDKISIAQVATVTIENRDFDHPHERAVKLARMKVTRVDGSSLESRQWLPFFGATSFRYHDRFWIETTSEGVDQRSAGKLDRLVERTDLNFAKALGRNPESAVIEGDEFELAAGLSSIDLRESVDAVARLLNESRAVESAQPIADQLVVQVLNAISRAAKMGYETARFELAQTAMPSAKASAENRKKASLASVHRDVAYFWLAARERNPGISRNAAARQFVKECGKYELRAVLRTMSYFDPTASGYKPELCATVTADWKALQQGE